MLGTATLLNLPVFPGSQGKNVHHHSEFKLPLYLMKGCVQILLARKLNLDSHSELRHDS